MNTVEEWFEHVEVVMGFKEGVSDIGDANWTNRIYNDFCKGKASFGATATNGTEAIIQVIHKYNPAQYLSLPCFAWEYILTI